MTLADHLSLSTAGSTAEAGESALRPKPGNARRILLLPRHPTSWNRLIQQAEIMARDPGLHPTMVLANAPLAASAAICRDKGIDYVDVSGAIEHRLEAENGRLGRILDNAERMCGRRERLAHSLPVSLLRMVQMRRRLRVEYAVLSDLCRRYAPAAIFVPGDRELSPVPAMLRVGLDLAIPTVVGWSGVPYGEGLEIARAYSWRFQAALKRLPPLLNLYAAHRHPRQVRESRYGRLLFSPGWLTLALAAEGMLSGNPWMQGGGNSSYLFHHSRRRMRHFLDMGVSEAKSVLVGDPAVDPLYSAYRDRDRIRAKLMAEHGMDADRKLIVVSVPNDFEHDVCDWPTHVSRMDKFLGCLAGQGVEVLLSLHPKSKQEDYQAIADRHGFHFAKEPLAQVLPAGDLFVCSGSSTILWASLCGIPAINLDYLDLDLADFKQPGIVTVGTADDFTAALRQFAIQGIGPEYGDFESYAAAVRLDSLFDGKAGERMCAFLLDLPQRQQQAA